MRTELVYENRSLYREPFRVQGYAFGSGRKAACIIGSTRGNEYQQLYVCAQLVQALEKMEHDGLLQPNCEILVIPCCNPHSMNIEKRFWPIDNTDINRMFPGYDKGETTQRIASGIFEKIQHYDYGIQFASYYMPGNFVPHVNIMKTGFEDPELAKHFGMPYVVVRDPRPYDTTTLNYNWQIWNTKAFSLYTTTTDEINPASAARGVRSVLSFLSATGLIRYHGYERYLPDVIDDREILPLRAPQAGLFEPAVQVEEEVRSGALLARILDPINGKVLAEMHAPQDGLIFYMHNKPLTYAHTAVIKMVPLG